MIISMAVSIDTVSPPTGIFLSTLILIFFSPFSQLRKDVIRSRPDSQLLSRCIPSNA
jgi:hypothetical protein